MTAQCNIITDSCCDLPGEFLASHGIKVAHFTYSEANKPNGGLAGVDDMFLSRSAHEFYEAMRNGAEPMTSQPSPAEFDRVFREALATGVPTVYLCFSSGISGCYEGAVSALERIKEEKGADVPLYIVDTKLASTAQALFIVEAINQRDRGLTAEEMVAWAEESQYFVHIVFMVDDLGALRRGGRIPAGVAVVGSLLDVKPMLTLNTEGKLSMLGMARGRKKGMRKFIDFYDKNRADHAFENVCTLGNADCPEDMARMRELMAEHEPALRIVETNIGPTIGCHVGPGMMSCCFWGVDRRLSAEGK